MGAELTKQSGQLTRPPVRNPIPEKPRTDPRPGTRPGQAVGNPSTGNSQAGNTGTGTTDRPRTGGAEKEKGLSGLATVTGQPGVNGAAPAPEPPKKKQTRKPRKKKEEPQTFNGEQLAALILSMSAIVGSRPGMEVWTLRPEEANQLATPISNMVAKSEKLQNVGEYADAISLVTASLVIFAPRAVVYYDQKKQKKIQQNGGVKLVRTDNQKAESNGSVKRADRPVTAPSTQHASGISDILPVTI